MNMLQWLVSGAVLGIVAAASVAALAMARVQARHMQRVFFARLTNEGNAPTRYEVWTELVGQTDAAPNVSFEFRLDGQVLATSTFVEQDRSRAASLSKPGAAPAIPAQPTALVEKAHAVADLLAGLVPGVDAHLRRAEAQVRRGQAAAARMERTTARYRRVADSIANVAHQRTSGHEADDGDVTLPTAASIPGAPPNAAHTPVVAPGQQLTLSLVVQRVKRDRAQTISFVVHSRPLAVSDAPTQHVQAGVRFEDQTGLRFFTPFAAIFLIAAGLIALLLVISARGL